MEWSDQLAAVSQMQHYIMAHSHEEITLEDSGHAAGYSKYHALHSGFDSHDGFTRAFYRRFAVTPHQYQNELPAVNWFVPHPIEAYYTLKEGKTTMDKKRYLERLRFRLCSGRQES